jgi:hypothetical protein
MSFMRKTGALGITVLVALFLWSGIKVSAEEGLAPDRMAWKLTIKPEKYDNYIDFPGTQIGSVIKIAVYHESISSGQAAKPVHYKNYYYDRSGKALGSKQLQQVTFPSDTRGPIMVEPGPKGTDSETATAAASVAVRLFLDLYTSKNFPQFIVVEDSMFKDFLEAVKRKGFKSFTLPRPRNIVPKPKAIMVLKSEHGDKFEYLMYQ